MSLLVLNDFNPGNVLLYFLSPFVYPPKSCTLKPKKCPSPCGKNTAPILFSTSYSIGKLLIIPIAIKFSIMTFSANICISSQFTPGFNTYSTAFCAK